MRGCLPGRGWPRTLRERLALAAALVTAVALTALTLAFNVVLSSQLRAGADDLLRTRAQAVAAGLDVHADGTVALRGGPDEQAVRAGTWVFAGRTALVSATADRDEQRRAEALVDVGERTLDSPEPDAERLYALPVRLGDRQVATVVTSLGLDPYERVEELALVASGALGLLVLGGAYLLTRTLVGRALTPVAQMTEQAARWSSSDLDRRFGGGSRPAELEALAGTLDGVLDRLSAVLRHEQQLSAELSHELRTPLAAIVAEVELLDSRPRSGPELAAGHAGVLAAAERMSRVLESLLTAARASTGDAPGRCDVVEVVHATVQSLAAPPGAVEVRAPGGPATAGVDAALLERALAPVLDNALRHRREHVVVEVAAGGPGLRVTVADDGPGVPRELADAVFVPGVRGADDHAGAGLGLALARRLVRAGGGELALDPTGPGARFVVDLPEA